MPASTARRGPGKQCPGTPLVWAAALERGRATAAARRGIVLSLMCCRRCHVLQPCLQVTPDQYMYTEPFMDKIKETFDSLRAQA